MRGKRGSERGGEDAGPDVQPDAGRGLGGSRAAAHGEGGDPHGYVERDLEEQLAVAVALHRRVIVQPLQGLV